MTCFDLSETPQASEKRTAREQRVAKLHADLQTSRAALTAEQDPGRLIQLLKQQVALQDALLDELLHRVR